MFKPVITKDSVHTLLDTKFIKVHDLRYAEGKHYFDASRRSPDDLVAVMSDDDFKNLLPDAVSCFIIVNTPADEPRLLLFYEFRYPAGRFLLSPCAGLIDPEDRNKPDATILTAIREIKEETGISVRPSDRIFEVSHLLFSSPGLTDESNALVCAVVDLPDLSSLDHSGARGSECFGDFRLLSSLDAAALLRKGTDEFGNFFSVYTWAALSYFISDLWRS